MILQIISDKNQKISKIKSQKLLKIIKLNNYNKKNLTIVIGGDGFMLKTLKKI
jgi:NAD+ kinase